MLGILISLAVALPVAGIWKTCSAGAATCDSVLYTTLLEAFLILLGITLPYHYATRSRLSDQLSRSREDLERHLRQSSPDQNSINEELGIDEARQFVADWRSTLTPEALRHGWIDEVVESLEGLLKRPAYGPAFRDKAWSAELALHAKHARRVLTEMKNIQLKGLQTATVLVYGASLCLIVLIWPGTFMGAWALFFVATALLALFLLLLQSVVGIGFP